MGPEEYLQLGLKADSKEVSAASKAVEDLGKKADVTQRRLNEHSNASSRAAATTVLLANAAQDASYGLQNSINNLMQLGTVAGLSGPWGMGIAVAGAGLSVLAMNWGRITEAMGTAVGPMTTVEQRIKALSSEVDDLNKKLDRTPEEAEKLRIKAVELGHAVEAVNKGGKILGALTDEESDANAGRMAAITKALAGGDAEKFINKSVDAKEKAGGLGTQAQRDKIDEIQRSLIEVDPFTGKQIPISDVRKSKAEAEIAAIKAQAREQAKEAMAAFVGAAATNEGTFKQLLTDLRSIGMGDKADKIAQAMIPIDAATMEKKAREILSEAAKGMAKAWASFQPTMPNQSNEQTAAAGARFQSQMKGAGVDAETQRTVAEMLAGKAGKRRAAMVPQVVPILIDAGFSEREIYEALPKIWEMVERGASLVNAVQSVVNQATRGGMAAELAGLRASNLDRQAKAGAEMLGIDVADEDPNRQSRFLPKAPTGPKRRRGKVPGWAMAPKPRGGQVNAFAGLAQNQQVARDMAAGVRAFENLPKEEQYARALKASDQAQEAMLKNQNASMEVLRQLQQDAEIRRGEAQRIYVEMMQSNQRMGR